MPGYDRCVVGFFLFSVQLSAGVRQTEIQGKDEPCPLQLTHCGAKKKTDGCKQFYTIEQGQAFYCEDKFFGDDCKRGGHSAPVKSFVQCQCTRRGDDSDCVIGTTWYEETWEGQKHETCNGWKTGVKVSQPIKVVDKCQINPMGGIAFGREHLESQSKKPQPPQPPPARPQRPTPNYPYPGHSQHQRPQPNNDDYFGQRPRPNNKAEYASFGDDIPFHHTSWSDYRQHGEPARPRPSPAPAPQSAHPESGPGANEIAKLKRHLQLTSGEPKEDRARKMRSLLREWHPDRNPEKYEMAKAVTGFLLDQRKWYTK